jgi:hypothetical protein
LKHRSYPTQEQYVDFLNKHLRHLFDEDEIEEDEQSYFGTIWEKDLVKALGVRSSLVTLGLIAANAHWHVRSIEATNKNFALELRPNFENKEGCFDAYTVHLKHK